MCTLGDIMSTTGVYHDECGDIMSTFGVFSTLGDTLFIVYFIGKGISVIIMTYLFCGRI